MVEYDIDASFVQEFVYVSVNMDIRRVTINNKFFQSNFIEKIANRKRPMELKNKDQYLYDLRLRYKLYENAPVKFLASFSYGGVLTADKVLAFSDYSNIFPSVNFGLACGLSYRGMEFLVSGSYATMENTFKDRVHFSVENYYSLGKNTTAIFVYSYGFDVEKTHYSELKVPYEKPDSSLINMEYDNVIYRVPRAILLDKSHRVEFYNIFKIDRNNRVKFGLRYSLSKNWVSDYAIVLGILF
jgi:hypothetical protein